MDITHFLDNVKVPTKTRLSNNGTMDTFLAHLTRLTKEKRLNLLEFTFMTQFAKSGGSIVNILWFVDIVNRVTDEDFTNSCQKAFDKLFTVYEKVLLFDTQKLMEELINSKKEELEFTEDQKVAIREIISFVSDHQRKAFGLRGYAGTGKTTTIVELVYFLIANNYIKNVAFTAPTNKAVNIMKSKMRTNIKTLAHNITGKNYDNNNFNLEDVIDDLHNFGVKIDFITIHRLLNYKNDFDSEGDRVFVRMGKSSIANYEFVIVDESSMIPIQIISHLFEDIRDCNSDTGDNYKKIPKLIFCGDPCQLFPVGDPISAIFINKKEQLPYEVFGKTMLDADKVSTKSKRPVYPGGSVRRYNELTTDILAMRYVTLREVVRNKIGNVVNLCYHIREWVENTIPGPNIGRYRGQGVHLYRHDPLKKKTEGEWFNKFIAMQQNNVATGSGSNIILTWTNRQTDEYNDSIRRVMFKDKKNIDKFEIGDMLMLNDFYNFDETTVKGKDQKNRFYTSEQIKVMDRDVVDRQCDEFAEQISKSLIKMKNSELVLGKYRALIKTLNSKTTRKYKVWKLAVQRMSETLVRDTIPELYTINVIQDVSSQRVETDKETTLNLIKKFRQQMAETYREQSNKIDREIIRPLWRQWNKIFIDPFARVNYGNSHSVHKSQGSSFYNVFVDSDDILNNRNADEAKRCIYTALTRASNEIHLLV